MKRLMQTVAAIALFAFITSAVFAQPPGGQGGPGGQHAGGPPHGGPGGGGPAQAVLQALDADGNHEISAAEISNASAALSSLDVNGDGKLSDEDAGGSGHGPAHGHQDRGAAHQGPGGPPRDGGGPPRDGGGPPHGGGGPPSPDQFVAHAMEFDADSDGKLDESELRQFAEQMGPPQHGPGHEGGRHGDNQGDRPQRPQ